jgi:hypothetical protein
MAHVLYADEVQLRLTKTSTSRLQSMSNTSKVVRTTGFYKLGEYHY